jgi:hypothetical protein
LLGTALGRSDQTLGGMFGTALGGMLGGTLSEAPG